MENASKALIIAASILVAILIVSMGITIFNKAQSSADTTNLDQTEINMFNQKFERYSGTQLGSQVKSLISFAISNASTNKDDPIKLPTIILKGSTKEGASETEKFSKNVNGSTSATGDSNATYITNLGDIRNKLVSTHPYTVTLSYGGSGLIENITINW